MLVLGRQQGDEIVIDVPPCQGHRRITVTVVDIRGDKVRIGTEAAEDVTIHRAEVRRLIDKQGAGAK